MHDAMIACRFVHFSAVLLLFGACLFRPLLLGSAPLPGLDRALRRGLQILALLGLLSAVAWLLLVTVSMTGNPSDALDPATLGLVLGSTLFGQVWSWHLGLSLLLLGCLLGATRPALNLPLSFALLATLAPIGHGAMLEGVSGQLLILNQVIHLTCVGAWLGGLLLLLYVLSQRIGQDLAALLRRFSTLGYALVAGILLSGLVNIRMMTGTYWPSPLFEGFALILLIKAALVAVMLLLALFNLLSSRAGRLSVLRTSVTFEWLFGLAAVAAVSLLGTLPPMPAH